MRPSWIIIKAAGLRNILDRAKAVTRCDILGQLARLNNFEENLYTNG
jgi:hypothetical protein